MIENLRNELKAERNKISDHMEDAGYEVISDGLISFQNNGEYTITVTLKPKLSVSKTPEESSSSFDDIPY